MRQDEADDRNRHVGPEGHAGAARREISGANHVEHMTDRGAPEKQRRAEDLVGDRPVGQGASPRCEGEARSDKANDEEGQSEAESDPAEPIRPFRIIDLTQCLDDQKIPSGWILL
nr:hypothetical protein [uncultured Amaricoccus sp.]